MKVIKRNGDIVPYNKEKIYEAIMKAMRLGSGIVREKIAREIADNAKESLKEDCGEEVRIADIEKYVFNSLVDFYQVETARSYEGYRAIRETKRVENTTDDSILGLVRMTNDDVMNENSNKNACLNSTQRDLIAGEVSKDISRRKLVPPHIMQAHDEGVLHLHDLDYLISPMINCSLINLEDMLDNGTVINEKLVETPKSFATACTVATQIVAQVASSQYGL